MTIIIESMDNWLFNILKGRELKAFLPQNLSSKKSTTQGISSISLEGVF
jgi:hypothetical protein